MAGGGCLFDNRLYAYDKQYFGKYSDKDIITD